MDNSWKNKLDYALHSSVAVQEPRNQRNINTGNYIQQFVAQDLSSTLHQRMHDHMPPNGSNFFSHKLSHSEQSNSYLALLSGPPSLLQCDFQELASQKVFNASRSVNINDCGSEVPQVSGALLSEHLSNQNTRKGTSSSVPPRVLLSSSNSGVSVLNGRNLLMDQMQVVNNPMLPGTEKVKEFSTPKGDWYGSSSANSGKLHSKTIQIPSKIPEESNLFLSDQSSIILSGCPRVFCLNTGGYLLLSNTGLLGIVCSCHFSHTSVSKFCEHSGFCDMNPGDAVRMESGETIAQWRKIYFEKFGIRVPEDQSGWDWPEGLLSTGGLAKSGVTMPKIANNSHLDNSVCSSQGFAGCMDNTMFLSSSRAGMSAATGLFRNKQEQKADGSSFLLKHLIGMPESNLHDVADGKRMECFVSKNSTISTTVGGNSDNCCPSLSAWIDSILKTGNSSLIHYSLQNLRTLGQNYDVTPGKIANDSVIFGRDGTNSSSSVELKLGQPYQQSLPMGNSCLPVIAPSQFDKVFDPPKTCYPEQMLHHARFFEDESRQYCHHDANSCDPAARRQQSQFNLGNHAFGVGTVMEATKLDKCLDDASKSSAVPLHPQLPPEGSLCSRVTNNSVFSMPNTFSCVADTTQCDPLNAPLKLGNNLGRQLNISDLGFNRLTDKGKGAASACVSGGFSTVANSTLRCHKQVQNPGILNGAVPGFSALHHKDSRQSSNIASEYRIDERRCLNLHGSSSFIESSGNTDRAFLKMLSSNFSSGQSSQSHAVSIGSPLATSTFIQGPTFNVSQQESPCLLDDSMRLVALKQIFELSKQHAISSVRMNHEYGRLGQTSNPSVQLSFTESSKSKAERHESILPSKQDLFKGASTPTLSSTAVKSIPTTGFHNDLDFSTLTQGISVCSREIDGPCQFSNESLRNQSALRLIRGEIIAQPSEHAKCCQRLTCTYSQGNCICLAHGKCLEGYSECRVGRSHVTSKEQLGVCCEAPMSLASKFVRDQIIPKDRNILLDEGGKMNEKLPMRIACHASQWRDVPSKQKEASKMAHTNPSAEVLDASGCAEGRLGGSHMHCVRTAINGGDSLKGQDVSNISSGCSAPAVTQASIEVNKMDSSTVNAGDNGYINGFVVDEGSGIDKCCSSDDGVESERSAEFLGLFSRSKIREKGPSKVLNGQSPFSLLDELKLIDSLTWKKGQKQICTSLTGSGRSNLLKKFRRVTEARKRKKAVKCKIPDASFAPKVSFQHCSNDNGYPQLSSMDQQTLNPSGSESYRATHSVQPRELSSAKIVSRKRILDGVDNDQYSDDDYEPELKGKAKFNKIHEAPGRKKSKRVWDYESFVNIGEPEPILRTTEKTAAGNSVCCLKAFSSLEVSVGENKARPIVCGEFGEICNGKFGLNEVRPAKIVPLSTILKNTENLTFRKSSKSYSTVRKSKKKRTARRAAYLDISPDFRKEDKNGCNHALAFDEMSHVEKGEMTCDIGIKQFDNKPFTLDKVEDDKGKNNSFLDVIAYNQSNTRCKEVRKRSLLELTSGGKEFGSNKHLLTETSCYMSKMKVRKGLKKTGDTECHGHRACNINAERSAKDSWCSSIVNADLFCCVCGSSNKDECNCLLECSRCSIRVHQACYGISKAPKGQWYCRPCRTSSKDIVCVLCGYGGGAMTRALQSRAFMKDLLKAWNIEAEWRPKSTNGSAGTMLDDQILVVGNAFCNLKFKDLELSRTAGCKMDVQNKMNAIQNSPCHMSKLNVYNSVTEGMLDSTVKQWVHMVCGLWTPGTRCPNVDTMSAFDVSGVSCARENVVCSICNRPGGSCIRCRVVDCSVRFHPWCAHQKGLLQSEVEGVDNENVGFYGRCMLHALHPICESGNDSADELSSTKRESICARTEGFKGRKQDGFCHNIHGQPRKKGGCFVPQEQLNAWIHINGQKSCLPGPLKLPASDIEYNCRKEYARYKQAKGWKHLVVYKSGIHALGLYTSQFISRGEMVVEYVGEIVGSRVADKRENEYQSGRKVQYKSACYFFRIDKEHIIDATRKGGIARFVNHSCLPNCVAKVISVRNEKKVVVFFAQRDIYPGEEITYDYNFNHEDEGKKIPCFCNSKNCRRYLN